MSSVKGDNKRKAESSGRDYTLNQPAVFAMFGLMMLACVIVMTTSIDLRGFGLVGVVFTLATLPMALRAASGRDAPSPRESFDKISSAIERLTNEGGLSETAKRVLHRKEERELLRDAIEQDIAAGDYDTAMILIKELADRFGYRADAEEFRARIERVRAQSLDTQVVGALESLEQLLRERKWAEAYAEAARIARLFPESHRVQNLRERVDETHNRFKQDLERRFLLCAQREQVEEALALLKELDQYLTEEEAEPYRELARGVIGKARDNLGVRFKLALQDRAWDAALDVGEQIVREFPNSRMAHEVREMIDSLRERAAAMQSQASRG